MDLLLKVQLYGSLIILVYTYIGYPLLLLLWVRCGECPIRKATATPSVTVVIAAWNEVSRIRARLTDCLAQEYPEHLLNIVVISDGSTDGTIEAVRSIRSPRIKLLALKSRNGKALAINQGVEAADGEIVVFTDARQTFTRNAVKELVANFSDPTVGAVTGELMLQDSFANRGSSHSTGLYWKVEKWIRRNEGAIDSVVGVTGAIYAIRKSLFRPLPSDTILDDLLTPMKIAMQGYRVVFEAGALAYDIVTPSYRAEFSRKVRTLAGNYQAISFYPGLLLPWRNRLWLQFVSHKVLRLIAPIYMVLLFSANLELRSGWLALLLSAQVALYGLALIGWGLRMVGVQDRWTAPAFTFCLLNIAAIFGAVRFLRSRTISWEKTT